MLRNVFLLGLVLYWSSTANAVPLENLCESAVFQYENLKVNSVHRVKFNRYLEKLGTYLIDKELDFTT